MYCFLINLESGIVVAMHMQKSIVPFLAYIQSYTAAIFV